MKLNEGKCTGRWRSVTYRNIQRLKHIFRNMPLTPHLPNLLLNGPHQLLRKPFPLPHLQKQHNTLIHILWSPLPDAQTLQDLREILFDDGVDVSGTEPYAGWIQNTVGSSQEEDLFCYRVDLDEVAVCPDVWETSVVRLLVGAAVWVGPEEDGLIGEGRGAVEI